MTRVREKIMYTLFLVKKPEGKGPLGGPRLRWEAISWITVASGTDSCKAVIFTAVNIRIP
jgi:hypothetical protein